MKSDELTSDEVAFARVSVLVVEELARATKAHGPMPTAHHALGVISEELWEFQMEVFKKEKERSRANMRLELTQTAAMCMRALIDLELMDDATQSD